MLDAVLAEAGLAHKKAPNPSGVVASGEVTYPLIQELRSTPVSEGGFTSFGRSMLVKIDEVTGQAALSNDADVRTAVSAGEEALSVIPWPLPVTVVVSLVTGMAEAGRTGSGGAGVLKVMAELTGVVGARAVIKSPNFQAKEGIVQAMVDRATKLGLSKALVQDMTEGVIATAIDNALKDVVKVVYTLTRGRQ